MKRICKQCGKEFILTQEEIAFYQSKNLHIPKRCEKCRLENKMRGGNSAGIQMRSVVSEETLSSGDYESAAVPGQEVRAYKGTGSGRKKPWIGIAAVLVLLIVGVTGVNSLLGQDNDAVERAVVGVPVEEIPADGILADSEDTQTAQKTDSAADADVSQGGADVVLSVSDTEAEETLANEMAAEEMSASEISAEDRAAGEILVTDEFTDGKAAAEEAPAGEPPTASAYTYAFRSTEALQEHFEKHGVEFGYASAEEYLAGANRVVASPEALHKLEAEDGDDVYYLEATNEFVIVSTKGYLRTYFKPTDGKAYYDRQ